MQNLEIEQSASIQTQHSETGTNPEETVAVAEKPFAKAVEELEERVFTIIDTLQLTQAESPAQTEIEVSKGKYLVVGNESGESGHIYFYVTSQPGGDTWSTHALTSGHSITYQWLQEEGSPLSLKINTWTIDPGKEFSKIEPNRELKVYDLAEAKFEELADIGRQFNKVIACIEDPKA